MTKQKQAKLSIRLTHKEKTMLEAFAKDKETTVSDLIRQWLHRDILSPAACAPTSTEKESLRLLLEVKEMLMYMYATKPSDSLRAFKEIHDLAHDKWRWLIHRLTPRGDNHQSHASSEDEMASLSTADDLTQRSAKNTQCSKAMDE